LQVEKLVLGSIARTKGKLNILLITIEEYNVDFLVKYKDIITVLPFKENKN